jgi:subtilisin family serine protease
MLRTVLFLTFAAFAAAQRIPGRYIVELKSEPAAAITAAKGTHYSAADADVQARRVRLQAEHDAMEAKIQVLGGNVTHHYTTLINGMAVTLTAQGVANVRQMPEVKSVTPVERHHLLMDQAVSLHRIDQAWQTLSGGQAGAGAGIKIGILDCGVDNTHPAFANFATPLPTGFPIFTGGMATASNVNNKVIVTRVYSDVAGGVDNTQTDGNDYCQHGTTVAGVAAGVSTNPGFTGIAPLSGVAPGAWIGNYKVAEDTHGASDDVTGRIRGCGERRHERDQLQFGLLHLRTHRRSRAGCVGDCPGGGQWSGVRLGGRKFGTGGRRLLRIGHRHRFGARGFSGGHCGGSY